MRLDGRFIEIANTRLQETLWILLQQTQYAAQGFEESGQLRRLAAVDFAGQVKQHRNSLRGTKVFVHRSLESLGERVAPIDRYIFRLDQTQSGVETFQSTTGVIQMHIAVIQGAAVVATHDKEANGFCFKDFEHIADSEKVAQALGHFFVVDIDEAVVHPHLRHGLTKRTMALGDFVFVVGKLQIGPATMYVKTLAE